MISHQNVMNFELLLRNVAQSLFNYREGKMEVNFLIVIVLTDMTYQQQ